MYIIVKYLYNALHKKDLSKVLMNFLMSYAFKYHVTFSAIKVKK